MESWISIFLVPASLLIGFCLPTHSKKYNRPLLAVFIAKLHMSKRWKFLTYEVPFGGAICGSDLWYYKRVIADIKRVDISESNK